MIHDISKAVGISLYHGCILFLMHILKVQKILTGWILHILVDIYDQNMGTGTNQ